MGQRVNYVIIENSQQTIYYSHWRATNIWSDLYLGEKRFLTFVRECEMRDELLDESSMEAFVIVDPGKKQLFFDASHGPGHSSVINLYVKELGKRWRGWQVERLRNWTYDVEPILAIDYASMQGFNEVLLVTVEELELDRIESVITTLVIIKEGSNLYPVGMGDISPVGIVALGEQVINVLLHKPSMELLLENYKDRIGGVVIDTHEKHIFMSSSYCGLWENSKEKWPGYQFIMGEYGYIDTLELAGIEVGHLRMPMEEALEHFHDTIKQEDNFDPKDFANAILKRHPDIQFNPSFFDNIKPKPTFFERVKSNLQKVFGVKN